MAAVAAGTVTETPQRPAPNDGARRFPLWMAFLPGSASGMRGRLQADQAQQRIDLQSQQVQSQIGSQNLINKSRKLGIRKQEQEAVLNAGGRFASLVRQGNMPGARKFLNEDDFVKRYFQVPPGSSMEFETFEDGSMHLYQQDRQGQTIPESSVSFSNQDMTRLYDRANPEAAKAALASRQARDDLAMQDKLVEYKQMALDMKIDRAEIDQVLLPFLKKQLVAQAERGAVTAQGELAREPVRQATAGMTEAVQLGDVGHQAGMRPDVRATERIGAGMARTAAEGAEARQPYDEGTKAFEAARRFTEAGHVAGLDPLRREQETIGAGMGLEEAKFQRGQQPTIQATEAIGTGANRAQAESSAILASYQASLINPAEGLNMWRQTGMDQKFTKRAEGIQINEKANTITLVDSVGNPLKYKETGGLAVFDKARFDAMAAKGKWKGGEWGMLNDETGQYVLFDGKGTTGVLSPQRMAMIREMNKNIRSHFGGMYDQAMDKWTFVDKNSEQKAAEAMALGQELMFPGGHPLNTASQLASMYAEKYPGKARDTFIADEAKKAGQQAGSAGTQPAPAVTVPPPAATVGDFTQTLRGSPAGRGSLAVGGTSAKGTTAGPGPGAIAQPGANPPAQPQTTGQTAAPTPPPAGATPPQAAAQESQGDREKLLSFARRLQAGKWPPERVLEKVEQEMDQRRQSGFFGTDSVYPNMVKSQYEGFPNYDRESLLDEVATMLGVSREQHVSVQEIAPWNQPVPSQFRRSNDPRRMVAIER